MSKNPLAKLDSAARRAANDEMLTDFVRCYDPYWRLTKLISIKTLLEQRSVLQDQLAAFHGACDLATPGYVYGPATNGLMFSAVAEAAMSCEDFFLLLRGIREREYFIRDTVRYSAGKVTTLIPKIASFGTERLCRALMLPSRTEIESRLEAQDCNKPETQDALERYSSLAHQAAARVQDATRAYKEYEELYNQYKHGLTVGLRPFGNEPGEEMIAELKVNLGGTLMFFDNDPIEVAFAKGNLQGGTAFFAGGAAHKHMMPLIAERNFLRYASGGFVTIDELIGVVLNLSVLGHCLINNRLALMRQREDNSNTFFVPSESLDPGERIVEYGIVSSQPFTIDDFPSAL